MHACMHAHTHTHTHTHSYSISPKSKTWITFEFEISHGLLCYICDIYVWYIWYVYIWYLLIFDLYIKLSAIGLLGLLSQYNISYHIHSCGPFIFTAVQLFRNFPGGSVVKNQLCLLFLTRWFCILWLSSGSVWVGSSIPFEYNTIQWSSNLDASRHTDIKAPLGYLHGWNYNPVSSI